MSEGAQAGTGRAGWPAVNPSDAPSVRRAAAAALQAGAEVQALPLLDAARAFHPRDPSLWHLTGLLYRSLDDLAPALGALEKASALAPGDRAIAGDYARAAYDAGLPASYLYERALRIAPLDAELMLGLAFALNVEQGPGPALAFLDRQLELHPGWIEGHFLFSRLACIGGQGERFADSLRRALAVQPGNHLLWRHLIMIHVHAGQFDQALSAIASARAEAGPHLAYDANEAVCLSAIGARERADRLFDLLADVDDPDLLRDRFIHLLRAGRPEEVVALAEPLLEGIGAASVVPFLSIAWRLLDDPKWTWLEGDERLVGVFDLSDHLPPLDRLADILRTLHKSKEEPLDQSLRGGTQTQSALFTRIEPEIRALRRAVVQAVTDHIAALPPPDPRHPTLRNGGGSLVRFSGSWSVRLGGGGYHSNHVHPDGWFSSALYIALSPMGAGGDDEDGWLTLGEPMPELGVDLPPFRTVEPRPGRLVLFPSTMWHGTRPFAQGERLTVAFDVAPPRTNSG